MDSKGSAFGGVWGKALQITSKCFVYIIKRLPFGSRLFYRALEDFTDKIFIDFMQKVPSSF